MNETDEIWALYADDGVQSLDAMELALSALKGQPTDTAAIGSLFRAMHTFKGNSRILGLSVIEALAHTAEDVVGLVRDDGVAFDHEHHALLLEGVDTLRGILDIVVATHADVSPEVGADLLERLKAKRHASRTAVTEPEPPLASKPDALVSDNEALVDAVLFDAETASLADDPVYRALFMDMVRASIERLKELSAVVSPDRSSQIQEITDIHDAAVRIGMPAWPQFTQDVIADLTGGADPLSVHARLDAFLANPDLTNPDPPCVEVKPQTRASTPDLNRGLGDTQTPRLAACVTALLTHLSAASHDRTTATTAVLDIQHWAYGHDLVGIIDLCEACGREDTSSDTWYIAAFKLADTLARTSLDEGDDIAEAVAQWCEGGVAVILARLTACLAQAPKPWRTIAEYLLQFAAACRYRHWQTSEEVTQSLSDICYRLDDGELSADPVLDRLLASFIETARTMSETENAASGPRMAALESLLAGTAHTAGRISVPVPSELLSDVALPDAFASTLSPESAERARKVLDAHGSLSIVHADFETDAARADAFATWIARDAIECIGSVTVFDGERTKFDFLLGAPYSSDDLASQLALLDPEGTTVAFAGPILPKAADDGARTATFSGALASELHEAVGELAVARSTVRQALSQYIEADLPGTMDRLVTQHATDPTALKTSILDIINDWHERFEHLLRAEILGAGKMGRLEEIVTEISGGQSLPSSIVDGMVAQVAQTKYVIAVEDIEQIVHVDRAHVLTASASTAQQILKLPNGTLLPVFELGAAGGASASAHEHRDTETTLIKDGSAEESACLFVIAKSNTGRVAFAVDELLGQQSVFVKPMQGYLSGVRSVSGCALLSCGDVGMVLDVDASVRRVH